LTEHPPLSPPPALLPGPVWRGAFRLNLPSAALAPPPDIDAAAHAHGGEVASRTITAPMPGTVIKVNAHEGSTVKAREVLVVLEAMKMETPLTSPYDATVRSVHVQEGDRVSTGAVLVELDD
jgi:glutaconyl-CoA decarboxylase